MSALPGSDNVGVRRASPASLPAAVSTTGPLLRDWFDSILRCERRAFDAIAGTRGRRLASLAAVSKYGSGLRARPRQSRIRIPDPAPRLTAAHPILRTCW